MFWFAALSAALHCVVALTPGAWGEDEARMGLIIVVGLIFYPVFLLAHFAILWAASKPASRLARFWIYVLGMVAFSTTAMLWWMRSEIKIGILPLWSFLGYVLYLSAIGCATIMFANWCRTRDL